MIESLNYAELNKAIFWDLETCNTNLVWKENKAWQLGLIVIEKGEITERHSRFVKWESLLISDGAAKVTHFNKQIYEEKAEDATLILDLLESYIYNPEYLLLGHNILGFDVYVHNIWRKNLGRKTNYSYIQRCLDTNALAKGIKKGIKRKSGENLLAYQYRMSSIIEKGLKTSLGHLGKENKIEYDYDNLHDGLADVILNKLIWDKYIKFNISL